MDNGLELTTDGYLLRPKPAAYRTAAAVGIAMALIGVFVVGLIMTSLLKMPTTSANYGSTLAVMIGAIAVFAAFTFVGWLTSTPPVLTVTQTWLTLIGGAHRRREDRSHVIAVYRGGTRTKAGLDKSYFVVLTSIRAITIPVRHFDPAGLEEAMRRLGVPLSGDFTQATDEIGVNALSGRPVA